jgi:hypothetical protein
MVPKSARNQRRHQVVSASAPVGGLNVRDAINAMPGTDAIDLINWIPQQYGLRTRKGYKEWCTNMSGPVRTVMQYQPDREDLTSYRLFAATDDNIYNVTSSTDAPPVSLALTGADNEGKFSYVQLTNTAGAFLLACTHIGGYKYYDGANWNTPTLGAGPGQVTPIDPSSLCFVTTWKRRTWFIEKDSTNAWYSDVDAITGTFTKLELGPFAKRGGKLAFIGTWTIDAGEGVDDFIVFGFENGDVLIYKGTDPDDATKFGLQGAYYVGNLPIGRRSFSPLGGDLLILTELGLQPLSYVTRGGQSLLRAGATDYLGKIQPRLAELVAELSDQDGWDMIVYPKDSLLIVNKPTGGTSTYDQYVLYTNTNTWTMFRNMPMISFCVANNELYFGTEDGRVCLGLNGYFDNVPYGETVGEGIQGLIQPAYNYYGALGKYKQFTMARPTFLASDRPSVTCDMQADYKFRPATGSLAYAEPDGAVWDVSLWDSAVWAGQLNVYDDWFSVQALGYVGSPYLTTVALGDTFMASIDVMFELGGPL